MIGEIASFFAGKAALFVTAGTLALGMLAFLARMIKKAGSDERKAKEADAYQKSLDEIARAGAAKPRGGLSDDPYNRDNRK